MPKNNKIKIELSYTCPTCKKIQKSVIEWQTESIAYKIDLETKLGNDVDTVAGDHESWACPCGAELPPEITKKVEKILW